MKTLFQYNGTKENLTIFGYDFSEGQCEIKDPHFTRKLNNLKDFEVIGESNKADDENRTGIKVTSKDLKEMLDEKGIEYKVNDSKKDLQKLLNESEAKADDENRTD